jgi:hypothetical protein
MGMKCSNDVAIVQINGILQGSDVPNFVLYEDWTRMIIRIYSPEGAQHCPILINSKKFSEYVHFTASIVPVCLSSCKT